VGLGGWSWGYGVSLAAATGKVSKVGLLIVECRRREEEVPTNGDRGRLKDELRGRRPFFRAVGILMTLLLARSLRVP
jgi:hypothetical protein